MSKRNIGADWGTLENLADIAELLEMSPETLMQASLHDATWPCAMPLRPLQKRGENITAIDYYLPVGSLDKLAKVYPKKAKSVESRLRAENAAMRKQLSAFAARLERLEGADE
jgi:hypothetical protein